MLKRRWSKFMCPNGIRRTFNPTKWEHGTPVLVFGEFAALCSAVLANGTPSPQTGPTTSVAQLTSDRRGGR